MRIVILVILSTLALFAGDSVWSVDVVKVHPGMLEKGRKYYELGWIPARREALKLGYIKSFRLLEAPAIAKDGPDFLLITEYASRASFEMREANFKLVFESLRTPRPILVDGVSRDQLFKSVVGQESFNEVAAAP